MRFTVRVCAGPAAMLCPFLSAVSAWQSSSLSLLSCPHLSSSFLTCSVRQQHDVGRHLLKATPTTSLLCTSFLHDLAWMLRLPAPAWRANRSIGRTLYEGPSYRARCEVDT